MAFSIPTCFKPALLLGLDIDHTAIRMVELSQLPDRRFQLERRVRLKLPPGIVNERNIEQPAQLAEHIAILAARLGSRRNRVALALPADTVITRQMQVPAHLDAAALDTLIAAEAGGYLTVAPDQVRVDYQFSPADPGNPAQRDIVLAAARREQVEDRIAAVEAAGLIPTVLDIDLYAAHAACATMLAEPAPVALLLCGAARTQIALFDQRQLLHHRELPGCGDGSDAIQVAMAAMRALLLATPAGMILSHIFIGGDCGASRLVQLAEAVSLQSAQAKQSEQTVQATTASSAIPATPQCSVVQPFAAMQIADAATEEDEDDDGDDPAAYLVACGLAMRRSGP